MASKRVAAVRSGAVHPRDIALREANWPKHLMQLQNAFLNQFEMPVLFYVLTILAIYTRHADLLFVLLSWVFVALRVLHAGVHLTSNRLVLRGPSFIASAIVLTMMWIIFIVRIMLGLP